MPYKDIEHNRIYEKGYWSGFIYAVKLCLGGKCIECSSTESLQVHHKKELNRKKRYWKDYINLEELELRCKKHHKKSLFVIFGV